MENPVPAQPSESTLQASPRKKYFGFSILAGFLYGIPTALIGFAVTFLLEFYVTVMVFSKALPPLVTNGVAVLIGIISAAIAGAISARMSFQGANQNGTPRLVSYGILSCAGIGLIGLFVFPMLCGAGYFLVLWGVDKLNLLNGQLGTMLVGGGSETGVTMVVFLFLIPMGVVLAYMTAVFFGGVIYRRLSKSNRPRN